LITCSNKDSILSCVNLSKVLIDIHLHSIVIMVKAYPCRPSLYSCGLQMLFSLRQYIARPS
jgi:hypothetical protein